MPYKDKKLRKEAYKKWRERNPKWHNEYHKKRAQIIRRECIDHYSNGANCCECCGENNIEFLALDHIHGGGQAHRKMARGKYESFYRYLKAEGFPKGIRILCHNCNLSLGFYKYCPHKSVVD